MSTQRYSFNINSFTLRKLDISVSTVIGQPEAGHIPFHANTEKHED